MTTSEKFFTYKSGSGEKKNLKFPKGKVELRHYTTSGLYMQDDTVEEKEHQPNVELRLCKWDKDKPKHDPLAKFFARDKEADVEKQAVTIGFLHMAKDTGFAVIDWESGKDDYILENLIHLRGGDSFFSLKDKDKDGKDVIIELHHKIDDYIKLDSKKDNSIMKFHHHKEAGFKVRNQGDRVIIDIYHPKNAQIEINGEGEISVKSPKKVTVDAPDILLKGDVKIQGKLDVTEEVHSDATFTAPNGAWHNP